jgi:geranylgeranyl diphosphate synthase type II
MIEFKTAVLLGAAMKMGAIVAETSEENADLIYNFGLNLGIAFQLQDDYLDAFGDPEKFGKEVGGDIKQNKKTFLFLHALEVANDLQKLRIRQMIQENPADKVQQMLNIFKECNVDAWANELKEKYYQIALKHLDDIAVTSVRKKALIELAEFLIQRES